MVEIVQIINELARTRPVFHSEADFQHSLAWALHKKFPDADVRLEVPIATSLGTLHVDFLMRLGGHKYILELKYKTRALENEINEEKFSLLNHGAQPPGRYDVLKDVQRLEAIAALGSGYSGAAILLTNDSAYWQLPRTEEDTSAAFSLGDGRVVSGLLNWSDSASAGTIRGREGSITLAGSYALAWKDYSSVESRYYSLFRYLPIFVRTISVSHNL